jgi:RNA polymerase sigma-54 factor
VAAPHVASDELTREIGEAIIQNLDEDGMMRASVDEIANMGPFPLEEVEKALAVVQGLGPLGVAARDLTECLRLQLKHLGLEGSPTDVMVQDHIKQLRPTSTRDRPADGPDPGRGVPPPRDHPQAGPQAGMKYCPDRSTYVIPDVFVVKEGDDFKILLNDDGLPKLRISPTYKRMLDGKEPGSEETRNYVKEKLRSALWLLKSVDQRQRTIYKVADSIVKHQRGFLEHGIAHLRPLCCADVANDIGMHESRSRGWWPTSTCTPRAGSTSCASSSTAGSPLRWGRRSAP